VKAEETKLLKFLNSPKQFVIPIYQRTYSWTLKECEQLWKDISKAGKDDSVVGHFIGSIVYVEKGLYQVSAVPSLLVIDGQQRLTTISLLLSALCNNSNGNKLEISPEKISGYFLLNEKEEGDLKYKLILTKSDKDTFFKIIENRELNKNDSRRLKENYEYFLEKISNSDLNEIYKGISKLIVIDVSLDRSRDNPQLIFESLNSTGLELTQADLIRNYVLMGLPKEEQEKLYADFWQPMEKNFGYTGYSELFDSFMRDYLTIKTGKIPNIKDVYSAFKLYEQGFNNINELVEDIYKFSEYFVRIALEKEEDEVLRQIFSDINTLKVDVSYPFILQVYQDYKNNKISKQALSEILRYIESYVFRRTVCNIPTNSLNKTFATLYKQIKKEDYLESFKAVMLSQDSYRRFPGDEEFKEHFVIKDVYNFRNTNYLLRKLENFDRKEFVDVNDYTIEHILPQNKNLSSEWRKELGESWKEVQEKFLHTIGNLTLTGYNSELSDRPFKEKRDMKGGFADSPIRLNSFLAKLEHWNNEEILKRANSIAKLAVAVWVYPDLGVEILEKYKVKEKAEYSLGDYAFLGEGAPMQPLFSSLRKRILNLGSDVKEEFRKLYIAYKSGTNFVDVIPKKSKLDLTLNLEFKEINDPKNFCTDITGKGKWGNGDIRVSFNKLEDIDYVMFLVKQAYTKISEQE